MNGTAARQTSTERLQTLGAFVRTRRRALGLTQTDLAERLGWSQERVSVLESGKYGMPSLHALALLATGLEISLADVIEAVGYPLEKTDMVRRAADRPSADALLITLHELLDIQAVSLQEALTEAAIILADLMAVDKIDAFILEEESQTLVALGASTTSMGLQQRHLGLDRIPLAHGTREAQVFETGEPYLTRDSSHDPAILPGIRGALGVQSMIIVPLDVGGKRQGVVSANSSHPGAFTEGDLAFLQTVARWVGMVAQRAELAETVAHEAAQAARRATAEELIQVLAHDLSNLLAPVLGRLDLIRRQAEHEGNETFVDHTRAATLSIKRIEGLVSDLLDATRLEHGLFSVTAQPADLRQLADTVVALVATEETPVEARGVEEIVVAGDENRLRQILENLLSNAVEHTSAGLPIVVEVVRETRANGEWAVVRVIDQGPGISPELMPTLFQRFSPGPGSSGLGLGLYLARGIAEAHGGTLAVELTADRGTTMLLAIPCSTT